MSRKFQTGQAVWFKRKNKKLIGSIDRCDLNDQGQPIYGISYIGRWRGRDTLLHAWVNETDIIG
mgnify:FL=1